MVFMNYKEIYNKDYFNGKNSFFYKFGYGKFTQSCFGKRYRHIAEYIKDIGGRGKVLDIGCAYGFMLEKFPNSFEKFGLDVSQYAVDVAKKRIPGASFVIGGAEDAYPYEENFFDVILANDLLEHLENPAAALKNIHKVLKKNGVFYLTTPNLNFLRKNLLAYADRKEHHLSLFSHSDLFDLLKSMGFKIEDHWTFLDIFGYWRFNSEKGPESGFICRK